ncbi:hypothetical protein COU01_01080 [Candidatus Falkowbacteria bacterium CG10_big_fil_rev_8_21_14_0_10_44_15]|uniref:TrbL/VirB6 plasmid conjugal transfer protein n=1 Tax=Candidatus Falkowbacteria bacterium CG10_big_fil_rev_8_21_14_0_10_44_15 TaxID=1974569 RepID=A0A2H0V0D6_9BACT|nr:MAG: hypothetical protein COU01_01080 [Candidatus Falkowbacteria bacterium CG10_big_fil_rev_8_21_14_0_10_44_15]
MSRLLKNFLLLAVFSLAALFAPRSVAALVPDFVQAVQEGNNLQWYLGGKSGMLSTTTDALTVFIVGARDQQGNIVQVGAVQTTASLIASTYNKPASSVDYVAYLMNNSGLAKSAYAQGEGWNFLASAKSSAMPQVILELWKLIRNVVYLFFIVIFVAIGFMIMFRSKLNPQTAVNIQLALPGIIVSLILVTFSFAISGLIIDMVYLGHNLIAAVFFGSSASPLYTLITAGGAGTAGAYLDAVNGMDIITSLLVPTSTSGIIGWGEINVFNQLAEFISIGGLMDNVANLLQGNVSGLIPLILAFSLLGTGLKIFFGLLTKYVTLILMTIFSPFVFLFTAFPGRGEGVGNFFKTMLSAALTFPATAFMFFLSAFFVSKATGVDLNGLPPLNETGVLMPSTGSTGLKNVLEPLVGLGILMAATQVPQAIDQALGAKPGIAGAATPDIGGALSKIPIIGGLIR